MTSGRGPAANSVPVVRAQRALRQVLASSGVGDLPDLEALHVLLEATDPLWMSEAEATALLRALVILADTARFAEHQALINYAYAEGTPVTVLPGQVH